jgi:hypothetical protein
MEKLTAHETMSEPLTRNGCSVGVTAAARCLRQGSGLNCPQAAGPSIDAAKLPVSGKQCFSEESAQVSYPYKNIAVGHFSRA